MATMLHPGVYVREIPGGPRSIEGVPTSTTIFVGETERGPSTPTRILGRSQYERLFGGYRRHVAGGVPERLLMPYSLDGFFNNGGSQAYVLRAIAADAVTAFRSSDGDEVIEASSPGLWGNSLSVAIASSNDGDGARRRIAVFYHRPGTDPGADPELVEEFDQLSPDPTDASFIRDVLQRSRYIRWRTDAAVPDPLPAIDNAALVPRASEDLLRTHAVDLAGGTGGDTTVEAADLPGLLDRGLAGVDDAALLVCASAALTPDANLAGADFNDVENVFANFARNRPRQDMFFVGDLPRLVRGASLPAAGDPVQGALDAVNGANDIPAASAVPLNNFNSAYWPHVIVPDPIGEGSRPRLAVPPAGHIAGLYARTDGRRGVWKAPAGTEARIQGAVEVDFNVLDAHQDLLNPRGINAIRPIPGAGLVCWGARTREPNSEWRYVPVRRTAIFLRSSIYNGIQWAVFEPNDQRLWQSLRNTIGAFMETQFRNGAFAGATSREAYFVKVDAETTTEADQAAGVVNILVGFAPLRPAEFVSVSLQQKTASAQ